MLSGSHSFPAVGYGGRLCFQESIWTHAVSVIFLSERKATENLCNCVETFEWNQGIPFWWLKYLSGDFPILRSFSNQIEASKKQRVSKDSEHFCFDKKVLAQCQVLAYFKREKQKHSVQFEEPRKIVNPQNASRSMQYYGLLLKSNKFHEEGKCFVNWWALILLLSGVIRICVTKLWKSNPPFYSRHPTRWNDTRKLTARKLQQAKVSAFVK